MTLYKQLCTSSLDISPLGLVLSGKNHVLGTSTDGKIVFTQHEQILANGIPVAKNFDDFLGLLQTLDADLIAYAPHWSRLRLQRMARRREETQKVRMVRSAIQNLLHPPVIVDPCGYIRSLQSSPSADRVASDVSVPFGKAIWHAKEVQIDTDDITLFLCIEVSGQEILTYYDRWEDVVPNEEQKLLMDAQNPFAIHAQIGVTVNGTSYKTTTLECHRWDPLSDNSVTAENYLRHYALDMEQGWVFLRLQIPYKANKKKGIRSLVLNLQPDVVTIPGPVLTTPTAQDAMPIVNPVTGQRYTFAVHSCTQEGLDPNFLTNPPCFYTRLCYCLAPALGEEAFVIFDTVPNDRLLPPPGADTAYPDPILENAPTAELAEAEEALPAHVRTAFSSRHYRQPASVNWATRFRCTLTPPAVLPVIR